MNSNELTLEELMAEYEMLGEKIKQKKQDDENRKKAELELKLALSTILISLISCPLKIIFPESCLLIPIIILASVDLPEPLGPVTATNSPSFIVKLTLSKIFLLSLSKHIFCISIIELTSKNYYRQ